MRKGWVAALTCAAVLSVPPEKMVLSSPLLTVAEREVTVVMN